MYYEWLSGRALIGGQARWRTHIATCGFNWLTILSLIEERYCNTLYFQAGSKESDLPQEYLASPLSKQSQVGPCFYYLQRTPWAQFLLCDQKPDNPLFGRVWGSVILHFMILKIITGCLIFLVRGYILASKKIPPPSNSSLFLWIFFGHLSFIKCILTCVLSPFSFSSSFPPFPFLF